MSRDIDWGRGVFAMDTALFSIGESLANIPIEKIADIQLYLSSQSLGEYRHDIENTTFLIKDYGYISGDRNHLFFSRDIKVEHDDFLIMAEYFAWHSHRFLIGDWKPKEATKVDFNHLIRHGNWQGYNSRIIKIEFDRSKLDENKESSYIFIKNGKLTFDRADAETKFNVRFLALFYGRELTCWYKDDESAIYFFDKSEISKAHIEQPIDDAQWGLVLMPVRLDHQYRDSPVG